MKESITNKGTFNPKECITQDMGLADQYQAIKKWVARKHGEMYFKDYVPTPEFFLENFNLRGDASILYMWYRNDWCKKNYNIPNWFYLSGFEASSLQDEINVLYTLEFGKGNMVAIYLCLPILLDELHRIERKNGNPDKPMTLTFCSERVIEYYSQCYDREWIIQSIQANMIPTQLKYKPRDA